jgi:hypothetical protein
VVLDEVLVKRANALTKHKEHFCIRGTVSLSFLRIEDFSSVPLDFVFMSNIANPLVLVPSIDLFVSAELVDKGVADP